MLRAALVLLLTATLVPPSEEDGAARPRPEYGQPAKVRPAAGLSAALFAKEPLVLDPVAFCIDEQGRIYLAESARQDRGIEDNRSSPFWLMDDIQSLTVEDRLKMYEKWASKRDGGMDYYRRYDDRVARLEDIDGDLRADTRTLFAGPFNEPLDGTGAGLIARDGDVWYTNIPTLWRLRDNDGDGVAEARDRVWNGFGVRIALRGHDMHGLAWGPDGKLYWSIGDRGYHVTLPDGRVLADPRSGAVFRCYPDGSGLELFCTGLRNPQELAFDDFGNLFTGDNNSDAGDKARIVYCVEGSETGWRMDYQTLEGTNVRGPWNQEETWALRADLAPDAFRNGASKNSIIQPQWTLPPLAHVSSGPSGLVFYPGLGLPARYDRHFFLCDFLGGDSYSRVLSFALEPVGAGFKVVDVHPFIENVLPTDIDFGYDGRIYVSDWGGGWGSKNAGEIYVVWDPKLVGAKPGEGDPRIAEVTRLFREGFAQRSAEELAKLMNHADQRVRQRAQFALAERGPALVPFLADIADNSRERMARIHAIWALGMIAMDGAYPGAVASLQKRLDDPDDEIRAQCAKVIGDARYAPANSSVIRDLERGLSDPSLRVRFFCAQALGTLRSKASHAALVAMLAENDGTDVFVRHAGIFALTKLEDRAALAQMMTEPQAELRLCAALVLRRWKDSSIARLLNDPDERIAIEAARAINDVPIPEAMPQLAARARRYVGGASSAADETPNEFKREVWHNVADAERRDLDSSPVFERLANLIDATTVFEGRDNAADKYVQRISGVVTPMQSGPHVFSIASDDDSVLFLGANESAAGKSRIAWVKDYTGRHDWESQEHQVSAPIMLEAGKRYYIEARHAENAGDDHLAVGWQLPDETYERPIGSAAGKPFDAPFLRRIINACMRSDDPGAVAALGDLARSPTVPDAMRVEALAALGEWMKPNPRDRVNGSWRPVDASKRDAALYKSVIAQKIPGLAMRAPPSIRAAARDLATRAGIALDGTANFAVVVDAKQPESERVACLRQLCVDRDARAEEAINVALRSESAPLRAEGRGQLARRDAARGVPLLREALTASDRLERQAAVTALNDVRGAEADALVGELLANLESNALEPGLRVDVLKVASSRDGDLAQRGASWLSKQEWRGPFARFDAALEGGDAARGFDLVHFHTSATCLKCHTIAGVGGDAAPKLDGVATRLTRAKLLESMVQPGAVIADGYGQASSAMPAIGTILSLEEIRDVVEYLSTLK